MEYQQSPASPASNQNDDFTSPQTLGRAQHRPSVNMSNSSTGRHAGAAERLSFDAGVSPSTATGTVSPMRGAYDVNTSGAASHTTPGRDRHSSSVMLSSAGDSLWNSVLGSPGDAGAPRQYRNESIRLRTLLSACRDELEEAKRQCGGLSKANEAAERELHETDARWSAAKVALEAQRRETAQHRLHASTLQGERDELEEKVRDAWQRAAELGKELRESEDARRQLQRQLDELQLTARTRGPQPDVTRTAAVQRQARVEHQALVEAVAVAARLLERADQRVQDAFSSNASAPDEDAPSSSASLPLPLSSGVGVKHALEFATETLKDAEAQIEAAVRQVAMSANALNDDRENNTSEPGRHIAPHVLLATTRSESQALINALRSWGPLLQRLGREHGSLVQQCERARGVIDALRQEKATWQEEKDWWQRRDEQLQAQIDAERDAGEAPAARRALAQQLDCLEDWAIIAHNVASLQQRLADTNAALAQSDAQKHAAHETIAQLRQQLLVASTTTPASPPPPPPASTTTTTSASSAAVEPDTSAQDLAQLQAQYEEALQYVRDELEPLTAAQASQLKQRRAEVDALNADKAKLEKDARTAVDGRAAALEALVVITRAYTGLAKETRELVQQRRALAYHALVTDGTQQQRSQRPGHAVRRWRRAVVAVLAALRLRRLVAGAEASKESWWPHQRIVCAELPQFTHRLRLPVESRVALVTPATTASPPAAVRGVSVDALTQLLSRWCERCRPTPSFDAGVYAEDARIPWFVHALEELVLAGAASRLSPSLAERLQRGLGQLEKTWFVVNRSAPPPQPQPQPAAAITVTPHQPPAFYSPNNYFTPGGAQGESHGPPGAVRRDVVESRAVAPALASLPHSHADDRPVSAYASTRPVPATTATATATSTTTPSARKQLFGSIGTGTGARAAPRDGSEGLAGSQDWPRSIPYPAPQLPRTQDDRTRRVPTASEEELNASLQRDRLGAAYDLSNGSSTGGPHVPAFYSVPGNGFAHEVLGVIDALDRRVTGALERSAQR